MTESQSPAPHMDLWSTLAEYERDEAFHRQVEEEFHPEAKPERFFEADGDEEKLLSPMQRRTFLKLSAFGAIAAMIQGCERPVQKILPYVAKPEEVTLGISNYYATTLAGPEGLGLLVRSREGRPLKLEGNPDHPLNQGTLDARAQAEILNLYNPDRLRFPMRLNRSFDGEVGEALRPDGDRDPRLADLDREVGEAIRNATGKVVLLTRTVHGPSNERLVRAFLEQGPNFEHVVYDPLNDGQERQAVAMAFGREVTPRYQFDQADVVLLLGGDPLAQGASPVQYQRDFAKRRLPDAPGGMSRVYAFEPIPTLSGTAADYRYQTRPEHLVPVGLAVANLLLFGPEEFAVPNRGRFASQAGVRELLTEYGVERVASEAGIDAAQIERVARSLAEHAGRSIVYTHGLHAATDNERGLAFLGVFLNAILGNFAGPIDVAAYPSKQAQGSAAGMAGLLEDLRAGRVSVLVLYDVNPVYTLPAAADFAGAMANAGMLVSLSSMMDETTARCDLVAPSTHSLEGWGDAEPVAGVYTVQQPMIRRIFGELADNPMYMTRPWQESVMAFLQEAGSSAFERPLTETEVQLRLNDAGTTDRAELEPGALAPVKMDWSEFVRTTWETTIFAERDFEETRFIDFWQRVLKAGVLDRVGSDGRAMAQASPDMVEAFFRAGRSLAEAIPVAAAAADTVLVAYPSNIHGDGTSMVNPQLLEVPDPASKVAWDNYAAMAPSMAERLGVRDGDHVTISAGDASIEIPAYIQPGVHGSVVAVMLGWGRRTFGGIGDGLGVALNGLLGRTAAGETVYAGIPVEVTKARGRTRLADVQGHNYLYSPTHMGIMTNARKGEVPDRAQRNESGKPVYDRPIIGETTLNEWKKDPLHGYPNHVEWGKNPDSMWTREHQYAGHHWGMSVDLNACTGCNACIVACSIENNVPVVGKDEVLRGREMHWIRLDRYYRGPKDDPDFVYLPLMCQHCDLAPCETVCPVIATMHNDEGLNVMTYNRCVGTRYCANNCPYKVRRFNFWQYSDYRTGPSDSREVVSPLELVLNPDVTTRSKGVMEKCTFCVHRIRAAKYEARERGTPMRDGEVKTACQQTCPAQAIHFGDQNDGSSALAGAFNDPRSYGLLADLNTVPSVRYMALVRNRDEPSPFRTKYQSHRLHSEHAAHGDDQKNGHGHDDHGSH